MRITIKTVHLGMDGINVLSNSSKYICWVALQNCIDYFLEVDLIGNNKELKIKKGQELKVFRLFLNSIESLNNVVDYLYFDKYHDQFKNFESFKYKLLSRHPILYKINEIANAYKHCKRGRSNKGIFVEDKKKLSAQNLRFDHSVLANTFRFWLKYHQRDGKVNLLTDTP